MPSLTDYDRLVEPHKRALKKLELDLGFFLNDVGQIDVFSITSRVKARQSAMTKSARLGIPVHDLDDLAGLRIVVGTSPELPVVERFFSRQEVGNDLRILKHQKIARESGYRATHLVVELRGSYQSSVFPGRVEIQLQTIFEHAFNFLSRSWNYKQPWRLSPSWSSTFVHISSLLAEVEAAASSLHVEVIAASASSDSSPLKPHSLKMLLAEEFDEALDIADCVDACRMYMDLGYVTNGQLRAFFRNSEIAELYAFSRSGTASAERAGPLSAMGRHSFWSLFGTRIGSPGLREILEHLRDDI